MTPAQQSALEACARRPLTQADLDALAPLLAARDDVAIAAHLSIDRTRIGPTQTGIGTILAVMAPDGGDFLNTIETLGATDANCKWTLRLIEAGRLDLGNPITRAQFQIFGMFHPTQVASIDALLAEGIIADPLDVSTLSDALNVAEGRLTMGGFLNGE